MEAIVRLCERNETILFLSTYALKNAAGGPPLQCLSLSLPGTSGILRGFVVRPGSMTPLSSGQIDLVLKAVEARRAEDVAPDFRILHYTFSAGLVETAVGHAELMHRLLTQLTLWKEATSRSQAAPGPGSGRGTAFSRSIGGTERLAESIAGGEGGEQDDEPDDGGGLGIPTALTRRHRPARVAIETRTVFTECSHLDTVSLTAECRHCEARFPLKERPLREYCVSCGVACVACALISSSGHPGIVEGDSEQNLILTLTGTDSTADVPADEWDMEAEPAAPTPTNHSPAAGADTSPPPTADNPSVAFPVTPPSAAAPLSPSPPSGVTAAAVAAAVAPARGLAARTARAIAATSGQLFPHRPSATAHVTELHYIGAAAAPGPPSLAGQWQRVLKSSIARSSLFREGVAQSSGPTVWRDGDSGKIPEAPDPTIVRPSEEQRTRLLELVCARATSELWKSFIECRCTVHAAVLRVSQVQLVPRRLPTTTDDDLIEIIDADAPPPPPTVQYPSLREQFGGAYPLVDPRPWRGVESIGEIFRMASFHYRVVEPHVDWGPCGGVIAKEQELTYDYLARQELDCEEIQVAISPRLRPLLVLSPTLGRTAFESGRSPIPLELLLRLNLPDVPAAGITTEQKNLAIVWPLRYGMTSNSNAAGHFTTVSIIMKGLTHDSAVGAEMFAIVSDSLPSRKPPPFNELQATVRAYLIHLIAVCVVHYGYHQHQRVPVYYDASSRQDGFIDCAIFAAVVCPAKLAALTYSPPDSDGIRKLYLPAFTSKTTALREDFLKSARPYRVLPGGERQSIDITRLLEPPKPPPKRQPPAPPKPQPDPKPKSAAKPPSHPPALPAVGSSEPPAISGISKIFPNNDPRLPAYPCIPKKGAVARKLPSIPKVRDDPGITVRHWIDKCGDFVGFGVQATQKFSNGDFVGMLTGRRILIESRKPNHKYLWALDTTVAVDRVAKEYRCVVRYGREADPLDPMAYANEGLSLHNVDASQKDGSIHFHANCTILAGEWIFVTYCGRDGADKYGRLWPSDCQVSLRDLNKLRKPTMANIETFVIDHFSALIRSIHGDIVLEPLDLIPFIYKYMAWVVTCARKHPTTPPPRKSKRVTLLTDDSSSSSDSSSASSSDSSSTSSDDSSSSESSTAASAAPSAKKTKGRLSEKNSRKNSRKPADEDYGLFGGLIKESMVDDADLPERASSKVVKAFREKTSMPLANAGQLCVPPLGDLKRATTLTVLAFNDCVLLLIPPSTQLDDVVIDSRMSRTTGGPAFPAKPVFENKRISKMLHYLPNLKALPLQAGQLVTIFPIGGFIYFTPEGLNAIWQTGAGSTADPCAFVMEKKRRRDGDEEEEDQGRGRGRPPKAIKAHRLSKCQCTDLRAQLVESRCKADLLNKLYSSNESQLIAARESAATAWKSARSLQNDIRKLQSGSLTPAERAAIAERAAVEAEKAEKAKEMALELETAKKTILAHEEEILELKKKTRSLEKRCERYAEVELAEKESRFAARPVGDSQMVDDGPEHRRDSGLHAPLRRSAGR